MLSDSGRGGFCQVCLGGVLLREDSERSHTAGVHASSSMFFALVRNAGDWSAPDQPVHVGLYLDRIQVAIASKKQILAGLRHFFDGMVTRHAIALNPALSVRTERYTVVEGKTPEKSVKTS